MLDSKGKPVNVGDWVRVIPLPENGRSGGMGWVRAVKPSHRGGEHARVDNGQRVAVSLQSDKTWTWSSWCLTDELEVLPMPVEAQPPSPGEGA